MPDRCPLIICARRVGLPVTFSDPLGLTVSEGLASLPRLVPRRPPRPCVLTATSAAALGRFLHRAFLTKLLSTSHESRRQQRHVALALVWRRGWPLQPGRCSKSQDRDRPSSFFTHVHIREGTQSLLTRPRLRGSSFPASIRIQTPTSGPSWSPPGSRLNGRKYVSCTNSTNVLITLFPVCVCRDYVPEMRGFLAVRFGTGEQKRYFGGELPWFALPGHPGLPCAYRGHRSNVAI